MNKADNLCRKICINKTKRERLACRKSSRCFAFMYEMAPAAKDVKNG